VPRGCDQKFCPPLLAAILTVCGALAARASCSNRSIIPSKRLGSGALSPRKAVNCAVQMSFGAVLYETLSGQRAFDGPSTADRASAILKEDPPDLLATRRNIPSALDRIVRHCLEKSPEERFQSARDLTLHLESAASVAETGTAAPTLFQQEKAVRPLWWMIGLAWARTSGWCCLVVSGKTTTGS